MSSTAGEAGECLALPEPGPGDLVLDPTAVVLIVDDNFHFALHAWRWLTGSDGFGSPTPPAGKVCSLAFPTLGSGRIVSWVRAEGIKSKAKQSLQQALTWVARRLRSATALSGARTIRGYALFDVRGGPDYDIEEWIDVFKETRHDYSRWLKDPVDALALERIRWQEPRRVSSYERGDDIQAKGTELLAGLQGELTRKDDQESKEPKDPPTDLQTAGDWVHVFVTGAGFDVAHQFGGLGTPPPQELSQLLQRQAARALAPEGAVEDPPPAAIDYLADLWEFGALASTERLVADLGTCIGNRHDARAALNGARLAIAKLRLAERIALARAEVPASPSREGGSVAGAFLKENPPKWSTLLEETRNALVEVQARLLESHEKRDSGSERTPKWRALATPLQSLVDDHAPHLAGDAGGLAWSLATLPESLAWALERHQDTDQSRARKQIARWWASSEDREDTQPKDPKVTERMARDLWWDDIIGHTIRAMIQAACKDTTNGESDYDEAQAEARLRELISRFIAGFDWGVPRVYSDAIHLPVDVWLTTNYTSYLDRAVRAAGRDTKRQWRTIATDKEVELVGALSVDPALGKQSGKANGRELGLYYKLHGEVAHWTSMAVAMKDKRVHAREFPRHLSIVSQYNAASIRLFKLMSHSKIQEGGGEARRPTSRLCVHVIGQSGRDGLLNELLADVLANADHTRVIFVDPDAEGAYMRTHQAIKAAAPNNGTSNQYITLRGLGVEYVGWLRRSKALDAQSSTEPFKGWDALSGPFKVEPPTCRSSH